LGLALARRERHVAEGDLQRVNVDTTVQEKIGHLQNDHRMDRCFGAGLVGDAINAVLAAAGSNLRKSSCGGLPLRWLEFAIGTPRPPSLLCRGG